MTYSIKLQKGNLSKNQVIKQLGITTGKSRAGYSIVGGTQVNTKKYPWFCFLLIEYANGNVYSCGATLLPGNFAISAAHCISSKGESPKTVYVVPNILDISGIRISNLKNAIMTTVSEIIKDGYDSNSMSNDIAILKLEPNNDFNNIPRIKLNNTPISELIGKELTVTGFGTTSEGGSTSDILLETNVNISTDQQCSVNSEVDLTKSFCASAPGKDACQGDSGGPIFRNDILFGVVSNGIGCAGEGFPGVYTDTLKFKSFIMDNVPNTTWVSTNMVSTTSDDPVLTLSAEETSSPTNAPANNSKNMNYIYGVWGGVMLIIILILTYLFFSEDSSKTY